MRQVSKRFMPYLDITEEKQINLLLDIMLPVVKTINEDESIQLEEMPTKFTRRQPDKSNGTGDDN